MCADICLDVCLDTRTDRRTDTYAHRYVYRHAHETSVQTCFLDPRSQPLGLHLHRVVASLVAGMCVDTSTDT